MTAVFSLWTDVNSNEWAGWDSRKDLLAGWTLAVHRASRHYDCVLYASPEAVEILEPLELPFAEVNAVDFGAMDVPARLWSFSKLYAVQQVEGDVLHVDHDVFLHDPVPDFDGALFQNREDAEGYHVYADVVPFVDSEEAFAPRPEAWTADYEYAYNCGIIGINDPIWREAWVDPVVEWARSGRFGEGMKGEDFFFPVVWEQYTAACAERIAGGAQVLAGGYYEVRAGANQMGYTHLVSRAKSDDEVLSRLHATVKREFPDRYATIEVLTN